MAILILTFLLFKGFEIIISKYEGYSKIAKYGSTKNAFLYKLSSCKFCLDHHLAIVSLLVIYLLTNYFELYFIIFPICTGAINNILNDRNKN